ncbi:AAA family ATPase [Nocardioides sp. NPDC000445]|uniref:AAA family ATPase n=1 Tax=Nocardioides sp. NPDC000445 TaxID=3154257 RepID=UPI00331D04E9
MDEIDRLAGQLACREANEAEARGEPRRLHERLKAHRRRLIAERDGRARPFLPDVGTPNLLGVGRYAAQALALEVAELRSATEGTRNDVLNKAAFSLGTLVGAGHLSRATVEERLTAAALAVGLDEEETRRTLASGLDKGIASPREVTLTETANVREVSAEELGGLSADPDGADAGTPGVSLERSWRPVDFSAVLSGEWKPAEATVGRRGDGLTGLFYPGRVHSIASESEGGKTWLTLAAALAEVEAGGHVVYLDFEDDEGGIVGRLLTMQADPVALSERFHYIRPEGPLGAGVHRDDLRALLTENSPTLAVIDGLTEALAMHGLDPNSNPDQAVFGRMLSRPLASYGAAVVISDHVTKASGETRGRYALGAVHKLNGLNGAAYVLESRTPFGVGITGRSTVKIAKDRPGQLRRHAKPSTGGLFWFADLVVTSHAETFAEVSLDAPHGEAATDFRPTVLMGRIMAEVEARGPLSGRKIRAAVPSKAATVDRARDRLILEGYLSETSPHEALKPWADES